jgi:hypothetical protein
MKPERIIFQLVSMLITKSVADAPNNFYGYSGSLLMGSLRDRYKLIPLTE